MNKNRALFKVHGKRADNVAQAAKASTVSDLSNPSSTRTVQISRDRFMEAHGPEDSFEIITDKIAKIIDFKREEVENALIASGYDKKLRSLNRKEFNALVQNALSDMSDAGDEFRKNMTILVSTIFGSSLVNDGFFRGNNGRSRTRMEAMAGSNGLPDLGYDINQQIASDSASAQTQYLQSAAQSDWQAIMDKYKNSPDILNVSKTADGGITETKPKQDWGSILSGSAQLVNSVGGIIGMFAGGNQVNSGQSVFDPYSQQNISQFEIDQARNKQRTKNIIITVVVVAVIVTGIIIAVKYAKKNKED